MWEQFDARNADRAPDWRWVRAGLAVDGRMALDRRRDDDWVHRIAVFRRAVAAVAGRAADVGAMAEISLAMPEIFWAHHYWAEADVDAPDGDRALAMSRGSFKYAMEARILARQTAREVAKLTGMQPGDVTAYEKTFFDVRPRLNQTQYIVTRVIGPALHRGLSARDYDVLWKLFGYFMGPHVLDSLMFTFAGTPREVPASGVEAAMVSARREDMTRHVAVLGKTWKSSARTQGTLLRSYAEMLRLEREGAGATTIEGVMRDLLAALGRSCTVGAPPAAEAVDYGPFEAPPDAVLETLFAGRGAAPRGEV